MIVQFRSSPALSLLAMTTAGLLAACASQPTLPRGMQTYSDAKQAHADIAPVPGSSVSGRLTVAPYGDGIRISGTLQGFPREGEFAFHIKEQGDCHLETLGSSRIFNPHGARHGRYARGEHMLGDMDNLTVDATLSTTINRSIQGVTLGGGHYDDIANRILVVHESPDDYTTQPAGNSGRPIACGVVEVTVPPPTAR